MRRGWLARNLPVVMQEDDLLVRFVSVFEEIATSVRHAAVSADGAADVTTAPPQMVRYLGSWVGAPTLAATSGVLHERHVVRAAGATLMSRGTAGALVTTLEALTGGAVTVRDSGGVHRDGDAPQAQHAHVVVRVETAGGLRAPELVELVRAEVPADVTSEIWIGEEQAWPTTPSTAASTPATA